MDYVLDCCFYQCTKGGCDYFLVTAAMPFIMRKNKFVIWDQLSMVAVAILSAIASLTGAGDISTDIGYLVFGLFWLGSCLTKDLYARHM